MFLHRYSEFKNPYAGKNAINLASHCQRVIERFKVRLERKLEAEYFCYNERHIALK